TVCRAFATAKRFASETPFCFSILPPPPTPTLFPYTTLFRSRIRRRRRPSPTGQWPTYTCSRSLRASRGQCTPVPPAVRRPSTRRSEEHTSELQSLAYLVCRLLLEKKNCYLHFGHRYTSYATL